MKKITTISVIFALMFLGLIPKIHGSGFLIYEHGAVAMAMAGAFVGLANDPSAILHNPAGIAWLEGTQVYLGTTLITSNTSLKLPDLGQSFKTESQWFYPSTFYITHKINDRIAAGFGFFSPYGLGTKWPEDFSLKYIAISDDMKTFFFNPTLAFKVSESLSLALGVSYVYSTLSFELVEHEDQVYDIGPLVGSPLPVWTSMDIPVSLKANGSGLGLNAGILYKKENFSLGLNWRGGFKIEYKEGDLELGAPQVQIPSPFDQLIPAEMIASQIATYIPNEGKASTTFNFPHIFGIGVAFNMTKKLIVTADVHYVLWNCFDKYVVDVEVPVALPDVEFKDKEVEEDWKDSFVLRGGFQYMIKENFALRGGMLYDQTPQPVKSIDPVLPDADRLALTGGFGYKTGNIVIDVAYQLEIFNNRQSPNRNILIDPLTLRNLGKGRYSTTAHLIGISVGFIF